MSMAYKHLTDERKGCIDKTIEKLRSNYSNDSGINFKSLSQSLNIPILETNKVAGELSVNKDDRNYVFVRNYINSSLKKYLIAHGLGHAILEHHQRNISYKVMEQEADYFAEKLVNVKKFKQILLIIPDAILYFVRHPMRVLDYLDTQNSREVDKLINKFNSDNL